MGGVGVDARSHFISVPDPPHPTTTVTAGAIDAAGRRYAGCSALLRRHFGRRSLSLLQELDVRLALDSAVLTLLARDDDTNEGANNDDTNDGANNEITAVATASAVRLQIVKHCDKHMELWAAVHSLSAEREGDLALSLEPEGEGDLSAACVAAHAWAAAGNFPAVGFTSRSSCGRAGEGAFGGEGSEGDFSRSVEVYFLKAALKDDRVWLCADNVRLRLAAGRRAERRASTSASAGSLLPRARPPLFLDTLYWFASAFATAARRRVALHAAGADAPPARQALALEVGARGIRVEVEVVSLGGLVLSSHLSSLALRCVVLCCVVLCCVVLSCLVFSCLVLPCLVFCCLALCYPVLSRLVLSRLVLFCLVLSRLASPRLRAVLSLIPTPPHHTPTAKP